MRFIFVLAICASLLLYAGGAYPQSDEICCTWVNTEYEAKERPQKMILNYDGTFEVYPSQDSIDPTVRGTFQIEDKWKDSEDIIWYKVKMTDMSGAKFHLMRIRDGGENLEFVRKQYRYPDAINTDVSNYSSYSRTELK